ncbi:hypothetical protein, conserved [Trypanosoma brucei gambiense DAL972]|uniref:PCIF1 WW domain-containing protein n=1 Tax=Trypanosoma brucei gambiense (strain MHOM/CI/86/DAL972) TaxID=679716 RepID=C9ZP60_TRYB9|nr:hypothetical protein, conserved [Trypanosoma brucei gambiense DAL972]CBH11188.1 hypothetical protein, conserved [Trypanosoma brucei gambiense DAL972]|eukprot:XP_011773475.1 hypothetical protein, conserved [Trypanosoma brucei gambiense DAL972]
MRVRTKREGVSNNFGSAYVNCEIISAFIKQKREENSSSGLCPSAHTAVEWSIRAGSRTAFLLHEVPISCGPSSPVGKECGAPENNDNSVENGDTGTYKLIIGDEVVSAIMNADDELDRSDALRLLSQKLCEVFRIPVGITTGDNSHGNCLWSEEGSCSVLTPQELRELPSRWIMQSLNEATVASSHRNGVTLLDCGATVCLKSEVLNDEPKRELSSEPVRKRNYKPGNAPQYRVCDVADMANGQYWVEVEPLITGPESTGSVARRRFDRDELLLSPPQPVYFDPLLPVDEINNSRGTSACLFLSAVLAVGRIRSERAAIGDLSMWDMYPKNVTLQMGYASRDIRRKVHELCVARRDALHVEGGTEGTDVKKEELELRLVADYVTLRYKGKTIEVLQRTVERLSLLWDARLAVRRVRGARRAHELWLDAVETQAASDFSEKIHVFSTVEPFFMRLFTLLLRYSSLFGDLGYNQGPHAAVPPAIMQQLCQVFDIQCEAFASPLNAQLPLFCSLFPDTDYFFGSLGSFFDIALTAGHFEVNPPFVTAVLQRLEKLLLKDTLPINDSDGAASMLFVVVLPSHDLDETERSDGLEGGAPVAGNTTLRQNNNCDRKRGRFENDGRDKGGGNAVSTDRALRESPYCLAHLLCSAHESVYVDGHQHMLRAPLFCIGSPTRLIVLGNRTARLRYSDAATRLQSVREAWRGYTLENRVDSP